MTATVQRLVVLGSTGSIGTQTLDVVDNLNASGRSFQVIGLSSGHDSPLLRSQIERLHPAIVCVTEDVDADRLRQAYPATRVVSGAAGLLQVASLPEADLVVNAVVGSAGLAPTLAALQSGKRVASANKESVAIGWPLIQQSLRRGRGTLMSIDSEHHALYRCLEGRAVSEVARLLLTASGGPFLRTDPRALARVTAEQALAHPTWSMGSRITIDCATMVNKAFEVIGAHYLFGIDRSRIDVVIHPQSWVHSMVEFVDGSILAELGPRDMRIAIQGVLCHPDRVGSPWPRLPLHQGLALQFEPFPSDRFPAFSTLLCASEMGGSALAAVNAADEVLISRFLKGEIAFPNIARGLEAVLRAWKQTVRPLETHITLDDLASVDTWARGWAGAFDRS